MPDSTSRSNYSSVEEGTKHFRMSDGFQLFYRYWKSVSSGRSALVCIHGTGENSEFFEPVGEALASAGHHVYAPDLRGFGFSLEKDLLRGDTSSFKRQLQDLVEVVGLIRAEHPAEEVFMLGHSHGCAYSLWYAANHAESISGIILAAPPIHSTSKVRRSEYLKFVLLLLFAPKTMYSFEDRESQIPGNSPVATSVSVRWLYGSKKFLLDTMFQNSARINKPVLILQGGADVSTLPEGAKVLLERLRTTDKDLKLFQGADHFLYDVFLPMKAGRGLAERKLVTSEISNWLETHQNTVR